MSYFVTVPPFNIFSGADHLAPQLRAVASVVELFSKLIATLELFMRAVKVEMNFCRMIVVAQNSFQQIPRLRF